MSSSVCRTHRGTQMGLSVNSRDSTPPGDVLRGSVFVRCRARRMSLMAASTESLLVWGGSRLILRCGWGAGGGGVTWVPAAIWYINHKARLYITQGYTQCRVFPKRRQSFSWSNKFHPHVHKSHQWIPFLTSCFHITNYLIVLTTVDEQQKLWSSVLHNFLHPLVTSSNLGPNSTLFSNTFNPCVFRK